jgi:hypothetical protein
MDQSSPKKSSTGHNGSSQGTYPLSTTGRDTPLLDPQVVLAADRLACMMQRTLFSRNGVNQHDVVVEPEIPKGEKEKEKNA